jgi:ribosome recycling factor
MSDINQVISDAGASMNKSISHLETELVKIRAGKASINMLDGIMVDYYGNPTPMNQAANITILDARTISVQPWEKSMLQPIERAIMAANIGITPQNDGTNIRLFLPPLTEERRKELVKKCYGEGENAKVSVRNIRRDAIEQIKKLQKDGVSEDECKDAEASVQELTDKYISLVDKHLAAKEKEIMVV